MPAFIAHGLLSYHSNDVLRFFGKRTTKAGQIPRNFHGELQTSCRQYQEGERIKFWMDGNSTKTYSKVILAEAGVLRAAETTINNVDVFRTYRPKEGGPDDELEWRKMRKGVADLHRRAEVSQQTNNRLIDALASVDDSRRLEELIAGIQKPVKWQGRRVRALRPFADDRPLLEAINDGDFLLNGFRNRDLQAILYDTPAYLADEKRRRSAAISRRLRMLRAHGLIRKSAYPSLPSQSRCAYPSGSHPNGGENPAQPSQPVEDCGLKNRRSTRRFLSLAMHALLRAAFTLL